MSEDDPAAVASPSPNAAGAIARGVIAGLVASLIGLASVFIAFVVAVVMRTTLLHKVMHVDVESDLDLHGGTALLAESLVAGAAGLFGAAIAAWIALSIVKRGQRWAFLVTAGVGFGLNAIGWSHGGPHAAASLRFDALLGWVMALAGLFLAESVVTDPSGRGRRK